MFTLNMISPHTGNTVSLWDSREGAAKAACYYILDDIRYEWDLTDLSRLSTANQINQLVSNGDYYAAVKEYNMISSCELKFEIDAQHVRDGNTLIAPTCLPANAFAALNGLSPIMMTAYKTRQIIPTNGTPISFTNPIKSGLGKTVTASSGATCRKCHTHNEYASADCTDGTYECRGCKGMREVFGG